MLYVGYAEADITPPAGSLMANFPRGPERTPRRALGAHDPLQVKALALSDGQTTVCVCAADVMTWQYQDVAAIRESVAARRPDLPPANMLLTATHTHSSGDNSYLFGGAPDDPWPMELRSKAADAILAALETPQAATLACGQVDAPYNFNRRVTGADGRSKMILEYQPGVTEGPVDSLLTVLRFDRASQPPLLWVHWAAHALTAGLPNDLFTADFPGAMAAHVEAQWPGSAVVFTQGAAGNLHPKWCMRADFEMTERVGSLLAAKALEAADSAQPVDGSPIALRRTTVSYVNRVDPSIPSSAEVVCLDLGGIVMGLLPGEPFVEFQLQFREALDGRVALLLGYANGWIGYVPTQESYAQGGYGVDLDTRDAPQYSRTKVPPGMGERLLGELLQLAAGDEETKGRR